MDDKPLLLSIAGYEILAYEGDNGFRVAAWKHPKHAAAAVAEYRIEEPDDEIRARRFATIAELERAVLQILGPR